MKLAQQDRLYSIQNPLVAITGGIATGKSFICSLIRDNGLPVISADQQIKLIYQDTNLQLVTQVHVIIMEH